MPSPSLVQRSGLERVLAVNRHSAQAGRAAVTLTLRNGLALATVSVRRNQLNALVDRVRDTLGLDLSQVRKCAIAGPLAFVWAGPGQWLAMADGEDGAALERRLRSTLADLAAVCDQSDARTIFRVRGARARAVLAKGIPIDLHPRAFGVGDAAVTNAGHIGVQLWQVDDAPTYELIVARSLAVSFWERLTESAAEFGYEIAD